MRFEDVEEAFHDALSESLEPRGFDLLFDLVAAMNLPPGSDAVDIGCRADGPHARELASRFGFDVVGIDPDAEPPYIVGRVEDLPLADESMDLVWCRDVLMLVEDLPRAFSEMHRVLRPGGRALIYVMVATDRLDPELSRLVRGQPRPRGLRVGDGGLPHRRARRDRQRMG